MSIAAPTSASRRGTALITALVILVGMVLLGLPFLFSQSASRAGSASFAAAQATRAYLVSAQNLGLALAIYTQEEHWKIETTPGTAQGWTALGETLKHFPTTTGDRLIALDAPTGTNQADIDVVHLGNWNKPGDRLRIGLGLSDESGRLNMNDLSPIAWGALFQKVGLGVKLASNVTPPPGLTTEWADWDDNEVWLDPNPNVFGLHHNDGDHVGQFINRLAGWRITRHFSKLEDLLDIDPPANLPNPYTDPTKRFTRPRLTRSELELLRPHLTLHTRGPGRAGYLDAGSVIAVDYYFDPTFGYHANVYADPDLEAAIGVNGYVHVERPDSSKNPAQGILGGTLDNGVSSTLFTGSSIGGIALGSNYDSNQSAQPMLPRDGIVIDAPAPINLHAITPTVGYVLASQQVPSSLPVPTFTLAAPVAADALGNPATAAPWGPIITSADQMREVRVGGGAFPSLDFLPFTKTVVPNIGHLQIPVQLFSNGITRIHATAQVTDQTGHPATRQERTVIVQAVPQEQLLETRWTSQAALQSLVNQRFASHGISMPRPVDRLLGQAPDDPQPTLPQGTNPLVPAQPPMANTGLAAQPLRDLARIEFQNRLAPNHLGIDWKLPFGNHSPAPDTLAKAMDGYVPASGNQWQQTNGLLSGGDFTDWSIEAPTAFQNDGLHVETGKTVAWRLDNTGILRGNANDASHLLNRHLSGWICPTEDWPTTGPVTIFEARTPAANLIPQADGTVGDSNLQNLIELAYDPASEFLVLSLAPPAAEHPKDSLLKMAKELPAGNVYPRHDNRSRAVAADPVLAPMVGNDANLKAKCPLLRTNRISLIYRVPGGFPKGQWRHIQVAIGDGRPGTYSLLVDGIPGRDLTTVPTATGKQFGDHALFPTLVLKDELPFLPIPTTNAQSLLLRPAKIEVKLGALVQELGLKALDLFPKRGCVRVGDEFITYDELTETTGSGGTITLTSCRRGAKQDSFVGNSDPAVNWPCTARHPAGALVIPGSYRVSLQNCILYAGKTSLKYDLTNGDTTGGSVHPFETWAPCSVSTPSVLDVGSTLFMSSALPWPKDGIVEVRVNNASNFYAYTEGSTTSLPNLMSLNGFTWQGTPLVTGPARALTGSETIFVRLVSIAVKEDPMPNAGGSTLPSFPGDGHMFQVMDPIGRMEWIAYNAICKDAAGLNFYFVNRSAWNEGQRGRFRTIFDWDNAPVFPAGSTILPVQQENYVGPGQFLNPGEAVTVLPTDLAKGTPRQYIIRFVATDAYGDPTDTNLAQNDTVNGYFSLTDAADPNPANSFATDGWQMICGPGFSGGRNLAPFVPTQSLATALPRIDLFHSGKKVDPAGDGRLVIGSADPVRSAAGATHPGVILDNWCSGPWPETANVVAFFSNGAQVNTLAATDTLGTATYLLLDGTALHTPSYGLVELDGEVFAYKAMVDVISATDPTSYADPAMQAIDAVIDSWYTQEVATGRSLPTAPAGPPRRWVASNRVVQLIGRGLLGSQPRDHELNPDDAGPPPSTYNPNTAWTQMPLIRLPLGPVGVISEPANLMTADTWAEIASDADVPTTLPIQGRTSSLAGLLASPTLLVCDAIPADPAAPVIECLQVVGPNRRAPYTDPHSNLDVPNPDFRKVMTAPWQRGLYNTPVNTWTDGSNGLHPLVIGWWPRHASALPASGLTAHHMRSRTFGWVGFPMRFVRGQFDATTPFTVNIDQNNPANQACQGFFSLNARAMAGTVQGSDVVTGAWRAASGAVGSSFSDWTLRPMTPVPLSQPITVLTDLYRDFAKKEVDGVEVRVAWQYVAAPSAKLEDLPASMNRAPVIQGVKMTGHAPACVVGVEEK